MMDKKSQADITINIQKVSKFSWSTVILWILGSLFLLFIVLNNPISDEGLEIASISKENGTYWPVVLFHGMGDSCCCAGDSLEYSLDQDVYNFNEIPESGCASSMQRFAKIIKNQTQSSDIFVYSIDQSLSNGKYRPDEDVKASFLGVAFEQIDKICLEMQSEPELLRGFNAIGFSQGGQFLRALLQRCDGLKFRNLVTLGAQHSGVSSIPNCADNQSAWCKLASRLLYGPIFTKFVQSRVIQAQYFKPKENSRQQTYLESSGFLRFINNEIEHDLAKKYRRNLLNLQGKLVMVMYERDNMVVPKESAWFGFWNTSSESRGEILKLQDQPIYIDDKIGLRHLDQAGKLSFLKVDGEHLETPRKFLIEEIISRYLLEQK